MTLRRVLAATGAALGGMLPAMALAAGATVGGPLPEYHLALWHGLNLPLLLSGLAVVGGLLLLAAFAPVRAAHDAVPRPDAKRIYEGLVERAAALSGRIAGGLHDGSLQRYVAAVTGAIVVVGFVGYFTGHRAPGDRPLLDPDVQSWVAWLLLVSAAASLVVLHRQRLLALVLTSVIGLVVSMAFLYLSAPDLALTQISVEVVTTSLLLLALNFLPKETPREASRPRLVRDAVLALASGLGVGWIAWSVSTRDFETISAYHVAESLPQGGGSNVVNVILVDFRGYDTFGEIIVLGIAGLIVFALLDGALRGPAARRLANWVPDMLRAGDQHPVMMVVMTRLILPLALMVGVYIFLRGHNQPGGGFIAGLVVSIALLMQYMASGFSWAEARLRFDYHLRSSTSACSSPSWVP